MRATIQTGFLSSVLAVAVLCLYLRRITGLFGFPYVTFYLSYSAPWLTFFLHHSWFLLGKSYVISLLANLNARTYRTRSIHISDIDTPQLSSMHFDSPIRQAPDDDDNSHNHGMSAFIRSLSGTSTQRRTTTNIVDLESQVPRSVLNPVSLAPTNSHGPEKVRM